MISFVGMEQAKLVDNIKWYLENGNCGIGFVLIHSKPVQLVVNQPVAMPNSSRRRNQSVRSIQPHFIQQTQPQMYELTNINKWLAQQGTKTDPTSRLPVVKLKTLKTYEADFESDDNLSRLTWFIQNYLKSLHAHIYEGNEQEISAWLDAWKIAAPLEDLNIFLPNQKSIMQNVTIAPFRSRLVTLLEDHYQMIETLTPYAAFMEFLEQTAKVHDPLLCDELLAKALKKSAVDKNCFLNARLLAPNSDDITANNKTHIGLHSLQLACLLSNVSAVSALIRAGAQLCPAPKKWHHSEIEIAVTEKSVDVFRALKPLYMPTQFTTVMYTVIECLMENDSPEFLDELYYFGIVIEPKSLLLSAIEHDAEKCFTHLIQKYPQALASFNSSELDEMWSHVWDNISITDRIRTCGIISELLKYKSNYDLAIYTVPDDMQEKVLLSHNAWALTQQVIQARVHNLINGKVDAHDSAEDISLALYQFLYANESVIKALFNINNRQNFIDLFALGRINNGDFAPHTMLNAVKRICATTPLRFSIATTSTTASNTRSGNEEIKTEQPRKRHRPN